MEPPSYCARYLARSGLNPHGGIAQEFKHLVSILWMIVCDDRLDVLNVSWSEYVCRRILVTLEFGKYMAEVQKSEAQVLKQSRMVKEEAVALEKKKKGGGGGGGGGGKPGDKPGGQ